MEDDDWELTAEELDSLERDAFRKIAQLRHSSSPSSSQQFNVHQQQPKPPSSSHSQPNPISDSRPQRVDALSQGARALPPSLKPGTKIDEPSKERPKFSVKFFLHSSGHIAAKFQYDQVIIAAFRKIPTASWNAKERLWMFPPSSLSEAEKVLGELPNYNVQVEKLDPLVHRAFVSASAVPDLRDRYNKIPSYIESKLLPFQREGVRFILQHGGRALLADEMGLGKILQAIAVASCIQDSWPVLILAPSSLRLQWASVIYDSTMVESSFFGYTYCLISYDLVPKLQNMLTTLDFKFVIADESHYLKNAQAKRTTATLPVIKLASLELNMQYCLVPALSRPIELFKQLEALYPDVYKNVHEYGNRYCKGGVFGVYQGASNHEELHNLMKATVMIRRLKKDVLSQLPVKRRQQVLLDLSDKDMKQINALFRELEMLKAKIKATKSKDEAESLKFTQKNLINKVCMEEA